jgi:NAD(P)-dependent dehydrogenase (short-subunit alcohol dehydrogenase family)
MATSTDKVIILTGASRGIGLAMARFLLQQEKAKHKLVVVARTAGPLEELRKAYPGRVEVLVGDLGDFDVSLGGLGELRDSPSFFFGREGGWRVRGGCFIQALVFPFPSRRNKLN